MQLGREQERLNLLFLADEWLMRMHLLRLPSIVVYLLVVKLVISRGEKKLLGVAVLARVGGGRV